MASITVSIKTSTIEISDVVRLFAEETQLLAEQLASSGIVLGGKDGELNLTGHQYEVPGSAFRTCGSDGHPLDM